MAEKRKYTEVVASIETHILYMSKDIKSIKEHLGELNNHVGTQDVRITKNTSNISWLMRIGGGLLTIGSIVALVLKITGFY